MRRYPLRLNKLNTEAIIRINYKGMQSQSSLPYTFCYSQRNQEFPVMLSSPETIISYMFQHVEYEFIWFNEAPITTQQSVCISKMKTELDIRIEYFSNPQELDKYFAQDVKKCFVLICSQPSLSIAEEVGKKYTKQVKEGIIYPYSQKNSYVAEFDEDQPENKTGYQALFQKATNQTQLQQLVQVYRKKQTQFQILPNFIFLNENIWSSNMTVMTLHAMLKQQIHNETRCQIVLELKKLLKRIAEVNSEFKTDEKELEEFLEELGLNNLSIERAIYWYTRQSAIYKFMNNLFRSAKHPTEHFYFQPFYKDLFSAVFQLNKKQSNKKQLQEFVCYRGGRATEQEIRGLTQNIGEVVQNLGFLSTSLSSETANKFFKNIFFQIIVKNHKSQEQNFGYAWIAEKSYFYEEQQILFNPLNSFKILQITRKQDTELYYVKLSYGQLSSLVKKNQKILTNKQKMYREINRLQGKDGNRVQCQGNVLVNRQVNLKGGSQYWKKLTEIAKLDEKKRYGYFYLARFELNAGNYDKALIYLKQEKYLIDKVIEQTGLLNLGNFNQAEELQSLQISKIQEIQKQMKKLDDKHLKKSDKLWLEAYFSNLSFTAMVYQQQGLLDKALELHQKSLLFRVKIWGIQDQQAVGVLYNIAILFFAKNKFDKSLQYYRKSLKVSLQVLGQYHPLSLQIVVGMGHFYQEKKEFHQSLQLYQNCLKIQLKILGENHPEYADSLGNLAIAYKNIGKLNQALQICQKSLTIRLKAQLQSQINFSQTLDLMASIYTNLSKFNQALKYYKKCEVLKANLLGNNHHSYMKTLANISHCYVCMNQFHQAVWYYKRAGKIALHNFGSQDGLYVQILGSISNLYLRMGDHENFFKFFKPYMSILSKDPKNIEKYENCLWTLASLYKNLREYCKLRSTFIKICKVRQKYRGFDQVYKISQKNADKIEQQIKRKQNTDMRYMSFK